METACPEMPRLTLGQLNGKALAEHPNHANWKANANGVNASLPDAFYNDLDPDKEVMHERPWHRVAISMAQNGFNHAEIARALDVTPNHISRVLRQPWARKHMIAEIKQNTKDELRSMIETAAKDAFLRIIQIAEDPKTPPAVKLSANQEALNRFLGKPTQPISTGSDDLAKLSDKELERIATSGRATAPSPPNTQQPD